MRNHREINAFNSYIKASLSPSLTIAKGSFTGAFGRKRQRRTSNHDIYVEPGVEALQVTIEVTAGDAAR